MKKIVLTTVKKKKLFEWTLCYQFYLSKEMIFE